ncbi:hypothetical protein HU200_035616 [Digitaria exilis]|uniref:Protein kinase domain-containing protein n=1 Tax=Digitaria exilis TaxID=1010633 RepID=A0A835EN14_9POAL|nr:hypothetical protein HU200_035616 [Digitaria exilis]
MALPGSSCLKRCGDVNIAYPFGIGAGCAMEGFELNCSKTKDGHSIVKFFGEIPVRDILLLEGQHVIVGCVSRCSPYNNLLAQDGICRGAGCCQVPFNEDMSNDGVYFNPLYNTTDYYSNTTEYRGYAVIMESDAFRFNTTYLNTTMFFDENAGHIDECAASKPPCAGCINKPGGSSIGVVVVVIASTCTFFFHERKKLAKIKQKYFQQHGGMLLLQEMSLKQGSGFSIFTEAELIEATDKFDDKNILGRGGHGTVYKGTLKDGSLIAVKRCTLMTSEQQKEEFGKEMIILSQINHKNIVKLLGCCLEVEVPMLVYEFIPNGTLYQFIHGDNACHDIPFSTRLHIALESALALAYLHSWASPPVIHGDVKSSNILLDENYAAKVSDFGASILAPTDESQFVTFVQGTCGYLDPEYMQTCQLTDKSDVYSFGVVLLELLTGKKAFNFEGPENERSLSLSFLCAMKEGRLMDIIYTRIKNENDIGLLEEVAELATQCLEMVVERRPTMRDVAEKLDTMSKVMQQQHPWVPPQHNPEEMESLLGESPGVSLEMISSVNFFSMEKRIVQGLLDLQPARRLMSDDHREVAGGLMLIAKAVVAILGLAGTSFNPHLPRFDPFLPAAVDTSCVGSQPPAHLRRPPPLRSHHLSSSPEKRNRINPGEPRPAVNLIPAASSHRRLGGRQADAQEV